MFIEAYRSEHIPLTDVFGVTYPDAFTHPRIEYEALTHTAGIIDVSHWGVLRLTGADRVRFLNAMVTADVAALATGTSCRSLITTTKGRVVAELLILARAEELLVLVMQGSTERVIEALASHIIADDVTLEDLTGSMTVISVDGPKSRDMVWRVFPREPLPMEPLKFTENAYQGMHATCVRHSVTGDKGMHVIVSRADAPRMRNYLVQGGLGIDVIPAGRVAWNMRRVENGLPWFGADVSEENFPKDAGLDTTHVSYQKGCYLGQETIARMHYRGHPNWRLVGLAALSDTPDMLRYDPRWEQVASLPVLARDADAARADMRRLAFDGMPVAGAELYARAASGAAETSHDAEQAPLTKASGRITSAAFSPRLKTALFLGYVRATLSESGARFTVTLGGEPVELTLVDLPVQGA